MGHWSTLRVEFVAMASPCSITIDTRDEGAAQHDKPLRIRTVGREPRPEPARGALVAFAAAVDAEFGVVLDAVVAGRERARVQRDVADA